MLSPDLELRDLDARHWAGWWGLLVPPRVLARPAWALCVLDGDAPIKLVVTGRGSIAPARPKTLDERGLATFAREHGVAAVVVIERAVLGKLSAEIEAGLALEQDLLEQGLVALKALKRHAGKGVWTEPPLLDLLPAPTFDPIQRTFDRLVPDRSALVAYVFEDDRSRVHASIIAVKDGGDIVTAATHRAVEDLVDEAALARAWGEQGIRATRPLLTAIEQRFARPSIALFLDRSSWRRIVTGPPDQLARELDAKKVVIDPAPAWLMGLLSGAAVAAVAGRAARGLAAMLPKGTRDMASALAGKARDVMKESGAHPFALLGFDPIELWAALRGFWREDGAAGGAGQGRR